MLGHSGYGDEQDPGDVGVAVAVRHQLENLLFPRAEVRDAAAAAFGVEVDLVQVRPQQSKDEQVTLAEVGSRLSIEK
jgi:hypothetical protein